MNISTVMTVSVLAMGTTTLALLVAVVLGRIARHWLGRRRDRLAAVGVLPLMQLADGEEDQGAMRILVALGTRHWRALEPTALRLLETVSGLSRTRLVALFERRGATAAAHRAVLHRSAARRARAAQTLGQLRHRPALADLCRLLTDKDPDVRASAARALGRIGDPRAAPFLLKSLSPSPSSGSAAAKPTATALRTAVPGGIVAHALLRLGSGCAPALRDAVTDPDPRTRTVAIEVLGRLGVHEALPELVFVLRVDPEADVRASAARALGRFGLPRTASPLLAATHARESQVRTAAAAALGELGDAGTVSRLRALLADPVHDVAREAAWALARLGPAGRASLEQIAHDAADEQSGAQARWALALAALRSRDREVADSTRSGVRSS